MADVGEVKYRVGVDDSDLDNQINKTESKLTSKFGGIAKAVGAATTAAVVAGTTAVAGLVKQATEAYGEYEQLVGGIETLFGNSAAEVVNNATNAFQTAGMSMNEYMETSIQSAAALINSLEGDTSKAAELMDMSIIDMSDNVNKMGTNMEAVQNAYRGFSRGNFTMLDNLALGFAGTKEGMQELLDKAEELSGVKFDISSYSDIVQAIHIVQEEMGITGTTAKEAASTIQGSMSSMKAAWADLVTSLGDSGADLGQKVNNVISTAETLLNNLLPVVSQAINGVSHAIEILAPKIAEELPKIIETALPGLLESGLKVVETLGNGILQSIPKLMPTVTKVITDLAAMLIKMAPDILKVGLEIIVQLALGIADALPELIPSCVDAILTIVDTLTEPDMIVKILDAALILILALTDGLLKALPKLVEKAPEIVMNLVEGIIRAAPKLITASWELILSLVNGLINYFGKVIEVGGKIVDSVKSGFSQKVQDAKNWGRDMIQNFIDGIMAKWNDLKASVSNVANTVKSVLGFSEPTEGPLSNFHTFAPDMMQLYAKGIDDNVNLVETSVQKVSRTIADSFTADVNYEIPDIAGYAKDLSATLTASQSTEIIVPLSVDGREIARATAWYTNEQMAWEAR